jgi:hypothetical protein
MPANPEIDAWFDDRNHPMTAAMRMVREAILDADPRVEESIKWKTPTWSYKGNIASINPQARKFVSLMFHTGARIPGQFPSLQGGGDTTRYMQFAGAADVEAKRPELQAVVRAWCDERDERQAGGPKLPNEHQEDR